MGNLFAKGSAFLARQGRQHLSSIVSYRTDTAVLRVPAVRGKTDAVTVDAGSGAVDTTLDDFLVLVSDLIVNGSRFEPQMGDTITEVTNGKTTTYEVRGIGGGPCFRYSDPQQYRYRIHVGVNPPDED
jgi:hypothetical protein